MVNTVGKYKPFRDGVAYSLGVEKPDKFEGEDITTNHVHRQRHATSTARATAEVIAPVRATADLLDELEQRGDISAEIRESGERFREAFHVAGFDGSAVQAMDYTREEIDTSHRPDEVPEAVERARDEVRGAMRALGGKREPIGCIVWDVVGEGEALESWVKRRRLNKNCAGSATINDARAYLIRGLQLLDAHYRPRTEPDPERFDGAGSLKDLARLTQLVAAIDDPAAGWLASALRYWQQHPSIEFEHALGVAPDARRHDVIRRRDKALRRIASKLQCRSDSESAKRMRRLFDEYAARCDGRYLRSRQATSVEADLHEVLECGGCRARASCAESWDAESSFSASSSMDYGQKLAVDTLHNCQLSPVFRG